MSQDEISFPPSKIPLESISIPAQQTVSRGTFVVLEMLWLLLLFVVVIVLFVTDSPIDGSPCDELECCGPFVVVLFPPVLEFQNRFRATRIWEISRQSNTRQISFHEQNCTSTIDTKCAGPLLVIQSTHLRLQSHHAEDEESLGGINKVREVPKVVRSAHQPREHVQNPGDAHHHHQLHADPAQSRPRQRERS